MILKELEKNNKSFEEIKHIDENGMEFWYARELMFVLQYSNWQNFEKIIDKAKISCENSGISVFEHFTDVDKMVQIGSGAERKQKDYKLSRYSCYLIAQNGDSRKKVIALAQTYFAVQTRRQELSEKEYCLLTEDEKRFYQRDLTRKGNYSLNQLGGELGLPHLQLGQHAQGRPQVVAQALPQDAGVLLSLPHRPHPRLLPHLGDPDPLCSRTPGPVRSLVAYVPRRNRELRPFLPGGLHGQAVHQRRPAGEATQPPPSLS